MEQALTKIYNLIEQNDVITIWGHSMPDGDCYGCQIGLREIIKASFPNKKVYALGSGLPAFFKRLSPTDQVSDEIVSSSLGIIVDASSLGRIEDKRVYQVKRVCKIDHHVLNHESFEGLSFVDANRVSCAEIIYEFAKEAGLTINKLAADSLYLGMITDSGLFTFYGTIQKTFEDVAGLANCGLEPASLISLAFKKDPKVEAFSSYLREKATIEGQVAYVYINVNEYLSRGLSYEVASSLVNALSPLGKPIYCLFTVGPEGLVRGELRSQKGYVVEPVASAYKGGGHSHAAGLEIKDGVDDFHPIIKALNEVKYQQEV